MITVKLPLGIPSIAESVDEALEVDCASQVCHEPATVGLVFRSDCKCIDRRHTWLLCDAHLNRGLQELRERFAWSCDACGLVGFWCSPVRVERLS